MRKILVYADEIVRIGRKIGGLCIDLDIDGSNFIITTSILTKVTVCPENPLQKDGNRLLHFIVKDDTGTEYEVLQDIYYEPMD